MELFKTQEQQSIEIKGYELIGTPVQQQVITKRECTKEYRSCNFFYF
jgi:hypothetical protein